VGFVRLSIVFIARRDDLQITPSVKSSEKIGKSETDSPFRAGQLRIFKRLRGAKKVSGPGLSILSQLLTLGLGLSGGVGRPQTLI